MSTPARARAAAIRSGSLSWRTRARDDPEPDRLAVDEMAAGQPLEVVEEEVLDTLDVARVPARVVERRAAPAMGEDEGPDPGLGALADLVEGVDDAGHDRRRVGDEAPGRTASAARSGRADRRAASRSGRCGSTGRRRRRSG